MEYPDAFLPFFVCVKFSMVSLVWEKYRRVKGGRVAFSVPGMPSLLALNTLNLELLLHFVFYIC